MTMSEHDETLRKALQENARLRSEREESLREVASSEYSGHLRTAERIYWAYAIFCVAVGVAAVNFFARSFDTKTLIGCAVAMLVIYETTVLLKLWFHMARMKMAVLKEMKLLRLELARLATAVGMEKSSEPPIKYEPVRAGSSWERGLWVAACVTVAIAVSTWTARAWQLGGSRDFSADTLVTLAADGSAEKRTQMSASYSSYYLPRGFPFYTPEDVNARFLDPLGHEMPVDVVVNSGQKRYDVRFTDNVFVDGKMQYTQVLTIPDAAAFENGNWIYQDGIRHAGGDKEYSTTILLPAGAELVSTEPTAEVDAADGRTQVRFKGVARDDVQYFFTVRYKLPSKEE